MTAPIGILYEHPEWFIPLFEALDELGTPYERILVHEHHFDPALHPPPYQLVVNRMSPSAYLRGHGSGIFYTVSYLAYLEAHGVAVINGSNAYQIEISKARQLTLFEQVGVRYPRARVINHPAQALLAASGLRYPLIIKPNIGGSGARIQRFDTPEALQEAATAGKIDLGIDQTALVQEYLPAREGCIVRVEVLDHAFLYAIKVYPNPDSGFNLCPADICQVGTTPAMPTGASDNIVANYLAHPTEKPGLRIEPYTPPPAVIDQVLALARQAHLDVGGIEYLVNDQDGEPYFYDVNALSNFVTAAEQIVGFNPYARLAAYITRRAKLAGAAV
ncbi:MAG: hypothetical protein D6736_18270 [Nitrospinota bacterium]|nr:MAG: hypothetical protein D6736_18270 [Nitrospinota bacterium]